MTTLFCRVCLASDLRLHCIASSGLQEIYERVSGTKLITADRRPVTICYICGSQLLRCRRFSEMSQRANKIFTDIGTQISLETVSMLNLRTTNNLSRSPDQHITLNDCSNDESTLAAVKEEFNDEEESYPVDDVQTDEMISLETVSMLNLRTTNNLSRGPDQYVTLIDCSNNESTLATVKEEFNDDEESSPVDDVQTDEMKTPQTAHSLNLGMTECTPVAVKKEFNEDDEISPVDDIQLDEMAIDIEHSELKESTVTSKIRNTEFCYSVLKTEPSMVKHLQSHSAVKPYACNQCSKTFSQSGSLLTHMRIHTGEKPYTCKQCDKSFPYKSQLQRHTRIHTGEKPYTCNQCDKSFAYKSHLLTHMTIHTGEKLYACKRCDKSFAYKSHLRRHTIIHTGEKPYTCNQCDKSFAHKSHLLTHIANSHWREAICLQPV